MDQLLGAHPATLLLPLLRRYGVENEVKKLMGGHTEDHLPIAIMGKTGLRWGKLMYCEIKVGLESKKRRWIKLMPSVQWHLFSQAQIHNSVPPPQAAQEGVWEGVWRSMLAPISCSFFRRFSPPPAWVFGTGCSCAHCGLLSTGCTSSTGPAPVGLSAGCGKDLLYYGLPTGRSVFAPSLAPFHWCATSVADRPSCVLQ